jgi:hypothetical protein
MITKKRYQRNEGTGNAVWDLFAKMAEESPSNTRTLDKGRQLFVRDQYGTNISYYGNTLEFKFDGAEDEDAVLFGTVISAEWPIRLEMEGDELTITCKGIPEQEAVELVKKVIEG